MYLRGVIRVCLPFQRAFPHYSADFTCKTLALLQIGTSFTRKNSACFEILGFDIMLDEALKPWLIEVNHAPSFRCDSKLDRDVKERVVNGAMQIVSLNIAQGPPSSTIIPAVKPAARPAALSLEEKQKIKAKKERAAQKKKKVHLQKLAALEDEASAGTGYSRVYPQDNNEEAYATWYTAATRGPKKYEMTAAAKAAVKASKEIRDGVDRKQKDRERLKPRKKKKKKPLPPPPPPPQQQQQQQQHQLTCTRTAIKELEPSAVNVSASPSTAAKVIETVPVQEAAAKSAESARSPPLSFAAVTAASLSHATSPAVHAVLPGDGLGARLSSTSFDPTMPPVDARVEGSGSTRAGDQCPRENTPAKLKPLGATTSSLSGSAGDSFDSPRQRTACHTTQPHQHRHRQRQQSHGGIDNVGSSSIDGDQSLSGTQPLEAQQTPPPVRAWTSEVRAWAGDPSLDQYQSQHHRHQQQQQHPHQQHQHHQQHHQHPHADPPSATHRYRIMNQKEYELQQQQHFDRQQQHDPQRHLMRKTPAMAASALSRALQRRTHHAHAFAHQPSSSGSGSPSGGAGSPGGLRITGMIHSSTTGAASNASSSKLYSNVVSNGNTSRARSPALLRAELAVSSHHRYTSGGGNVSGGDSVGNIDCDEHRSSMDQHQTKYRHSPAMVSTLGVSGNWDQWKAGLSAAGSSAAQGGKQIGTKLHRRHEGLSPNRASLLRARAGTERTRYTVVMPPKRDRRFGGLATPAESRQYGAGSRYHGGVGAATATGRYR